LGEPGGTPITIRLSSAGYYPPAVEIHSDHTRRACFIVVILAVLIAGVAPASAHEKFRIIGTITRASSSVFT